MRKRVHVIAAMDGPYSGRRKAQGRLLGPERMAPGTWTTDKGYRVADAHPASLLHFVIRTPRATAAQVVTTRFTLLAGIEIEDIHRLPEPSSDIRRSTV